MADPVYLLDSNICIYVLKDAASAAALRLGECAPGAAVTSAIAYAEVMRGVPNDPDSMAKAQALFQVVPALPFDAAAASAYARVPFRRGTFDRLIAAHALSLGLAVVTSNVRDYADVRDLKVEDWTAP